MQTINVSTKSRNQMLDVTSQVSDAVRQAGVKHGCVVCFVPHTTAGVTIQENADPDVCRDVLYKLGQLIPERDTNYQHAEGNSDAHLKSSLVGASVTVLVEDGRLVLGTWQAVYFCEFDGPRQRKMHIRTLEA